MFMEFERFYFMLEPATPSRCMHHTLAASDLRYLGIEVGCIFGFTTRKQSYVVKAIHRVPQGSIAFASGLYRKPHPSRRRQLRQSHHPSRVSLTPDVIRPPANKRQRVNGSLRRCLAQSRRNAARGLGRPNGGRPCSGA